MPNTGTDPVKSLTLLNTIPTYVESTVLHILILFAYSVTASHTTQITFSPVPTYKHLSPLSRSPYRRQRCSTVGRWRGPHLCSPLFGGGQSPPPLWCSGCRMVWAEILCIPGMACAMEVVVVVLSLEYWSHRYWSWTLVIKQVCRFWNSHELISAFRNETKSS